MWCFKGVSNAHLHPLLHVRQSGPVGMVQLQHFLSSLLTVRQGRPASVSALTLLSVCPDADAEDNLASAIIRLAELRGPCRLSFRMSLWDQPDACLAGGAQDIHATCMN